VNINDASANPFVKITYGTTSISSHLIGLYNANNISAAIAIGTYFKIAPGDIKKAIESYIPENNRSQLLVKNGNEIILDAYNANPSSMAVAIENFLQLDKPEKIMILGDMFELGTESLSEHKNIVDALSKAANVTAYLIGKDFFQNKIANPNLKFYETFEAFSANFQDENITNKTLLIKGSRGMALERTLDLL